MLQVEWNYNGNHTDRVLVLLPPLPILDTSWIHQSEIIKNYRKTLNNLCSKEHLRYIFVYIPGFDPLNYDHRCLFEDFYGKEVRLIAQLERILNRSFPMDYLTSECIYMLENSNDWENSTTPIEWYFDVVINEQMYEYYDSTSKWLRLEMPKFMEHSIGANQVYESYLVKLILMGTTKTLSLNSSSVDKDLVFIFGDVDEYEKDPYIDILRRLIADCRVGAIFSYGNMTARLQTLRHTQSHSKLQIPRFELYTQPNVSPELYSSLMNKLVKYSPTYTYFMWLGTFQLEKENIEKEKYKPISRPLYAQAFVYSPPAWCSLYPNKVYTDESATLTFEPCGMLDFFANES